MRTGKNFEIEKCILNMIQGNYREDEFFLRREEKKTPEGLKE
jgi:hypothetical protein